MTTYTAIADSEIDPESPGTTTLFTKLRDNPIAITEKVAGAPVLANDYIVEAMLTADCVTGPKIAPGSVGQTELNTTIGTTSSTLNTAIDMPGGTFVFFPETKSSQTAEGKIHILESSVFNDSTAYAAKILFDNTNGEALFCRTTYINACPPYDLGDGEIPLFSFLLVDGLGNILSTYIAPEAPWHYNGKTNIATKFHKKGKPFRKVKRIELEQICNNIDINDLIRSEANPSLLRDILDDDKEYEIEMTQNVKNKDMINIPHPFHGLESGQTVILLDPVSPITRELYELNEAKADVTDLIRDGYIKFGNTSLGRASPDGVLDVSLGWKNSV